MVDSTTSPLEKAKRALLIERFWDKVDFPILPQGEFLPESCWEWHGSMNNKGYGTFNLGSRKLGMGLAHRWVYELVVGEIPSGLEVMHSCDNRKCVNPTHLSVGTHSENMRDMWDKGRGNSSQAKKTHCPLGHPYDETNTLVSGGSRYCLICRRVSTNKSRLKRRMQMGAL